VSLPKSTKPSEPAPQQQQQQQQPPPTPPVLHQRPSDSTPSRSSAVRKPSFNDPEADPWGSPDMHKNHAHASYAPEPAQTNGSNAPAATRTTSQFTTNSTANAASITESAQQSSLGSEGGWGGYNGGSSQPFATPGLSDNGFGAAPVGGGSNPPPELGRSIGRVGPSSSGAEEVITITAIAEKEGMFLFQHRNYEVASSRRTTKVVRRYSDFVWLLDCLHKRYPFRQLPLLPPKRVGSEYFSPCMRCVLRKS